VTELGDLCISRWFGHPGCVGYESILMQPHDLSDSDFQSRFLAELLSARADELAELAATELLRARPEIAARYQPLPREKWQRALMGRVHDLATAVHMQSPSLFRTQVEWARSAFAARGTPTDDLRFSLEALATVLQREVPPEDSEHVAGYLAEARRGVETPRPDGPVRLSLETAHGRIAAEYLLKLLEGDRLAASRTVLDAVGHGLTVREAYLEVLLPVQHELGRMWHLNEVSVGEEHFATATTEMVMSQLLALTERRKPNGRALLAASVDGNSHDLGIRMVADFFELDGWRAVYLGASCPAEDLLVATVDFGVDVVALSAALPGQLRILEETIGLIRDSMGSASPKIIVGGSAFSSCKDSWAVLGADGHSASADEAVALGRRLVNIR